MPCYCWWSEISCHHCLTGGTQQAKYGVCYWHSRYNDATSGTTQNRCHHVEWQFSICRTLTKPPGVMTSILHCTRSYVIMPGTLIMPCHSINPHLPQVHLVPSLCLANLEKRQKGKGTGAFVFWLEPGRGGRRWCMCTSGEMKKRKGNCCGTFKREG